MTSGIGRPRGTRDFGPDEMATRRHAEARMRRVLEGHGFSEIQTPTFEELELFTAKSGDGIISELYDFTDKGGRRMALRPELTAPVMRFYYQELTVAPKPLKLYYFGNCFRYDRPQKGRYREFWQLGCELVGPDTPEAHAEVLAMGLQALRTAGVQDLVARIGHLGVLNGALQCIGWPATADRASLMRLIDKWDEAAVRAQLANAGVDDAAIGWFVRLHAVEDIDALEAVLQDAPGTTGREQMQEATAYLRDTIEAVGAMGPDVPLRPDPLIARGLDYYTGIVFEVDAPALGAEKQLLGGGGYDLSNVFGGEPVASCGFGLGFDRTLVALEAEGVAPPPSIRLDAYVAPIGAAARATAFTLTRTLRAAGLRVEVDLMRRNPAKNLKAAATRAARFVVLLGEQELAAGTATIKDLDSGAQQQVPLADLPQVLASREGAA